MDQMRPDRSELGRLLRSLRPSDVPGICERCGTPFKGLRDQRYCSTRCRLAVAQRAYRQRKRRPPQG